MKKIAFIISIVFFISCNKSDDDATNGNNDPQFANIETTLQDGIWEISNFSNNGDNETNQFEGFDFRFLEDGVVTVQNDILSEVGQYGYSINNDDEEKLNIEFAIEPFSKLNQNWRIEAASDTAVELFFLSASGEPKSLDFIKQ